MPVRRSKRRYGRTAKDVRRGGLGTRTTPTVPTIKEIDVWLRVNGVNVANTNVMQAMSSLTERETMMATHVVELDAGDYFELMYAVNDINMILNTLAADGVNPATPSVAINVTQVR